MPPALSSISHTGKALPQHFLAHCITIHRSINKETKPIAETRATAGSPKLCCAVDLDEVGVAFVVAAAAGVVVTDGVLTEVNYMASCVSWHFFFFRKKRKVQFEKACLTYTALLVGRALGMTLSGSFKYPAQTESSGISAQQ